MKKIIITVAFLAGVFVGKAQEKDTYNLANSAMTFLTIPSDARSGGMGDMGVATPVSGYAHQNNAAKYLFLEKEHRGGLNLFYAPWLRNLVKDMSIVGVSGYWKIDALQSVSASFRYFSMGDLKFVDADQQLTGSHNPHELALDIAYSRKLGEDFAMSLALRYGSSNIANGSSNYYEYKAAHVVAFDLTGYYRKDMEVLGMKSLLGAGFALTNIGSRVKYGQDRRFFLPADLKLGLNLASELDNQNGLSLGFEVGKYLVSSDPADLDKSVFGGVANSFRDGALLKSLLWKVGAEYNFDRLVFIRAGYHYENKERGDRQYLTFGAGVAYKIVHLDGSYLVPTTGNHNPLANSFRLSMSIDF